MKYLVKQVAEITGTTIRALHHYDEIGLLTPAVMNEAGYRRYSADDLARLQEILFFKELDFSLAEIKAIIESPGYRRNEALAEQKKLLGAKIKRLRRIIKTIDYTMVGEERGVKMDQDKMFEGLDDATLKEYEREAKERWGETDAYKESARRAAKYNEADWGLIGAESADIYQQVANLMDSGQAPADAAVQAQIKRWNDHITQYFYRCTPDICRGLGEMYLVDQRFKNNLDKVRPGLAEFLSQAMTYYADHAGS